MAPLTYNQPSDPSAVRAVSKDAVMLCASLSPNSLASNPVVSSLPVQEAHWPGTEELLDFLGKKLKPHPQGPSQCQPLCLSLWPQPSSSHFKVQLQSHSGASTSQAARAQSLQLSHSFVFSAYWKFALKGIQDTAFWHPALPRLKKNFYHYKRKRKTNHTYSP